jgi:ribonuclease G
MTKPCPICAGEGVVKSEETIAIEVERHLRHVAHEAGPDGPEAYLVRLNPKVTAYFTADGGRMLGALEQETGRSFHFEGSEGLPLDHVAITMEGTREEVLERAVPFRPGEEVHVDLVEPHMYNEDDAVAKVDGYLIEVANGIAFVGEKKLVRIEEAGRATARALLVGADAEAAAEAAEERAKARARQERSRRGARTRERNRAAVAPSADTGPSEAEAVEALTEAAPPEAGTAPAAAAEADGDGDGDAVDSKPRRRGRRGGRRRSRAKAESEVTE